MSSKTRGFTFLVMDRARLLAGQFQLLMEVSAFSHKTQKILVGRAESWN